MYERRPGFFRNDDATPGRRVEARVKWFNVSKGFGFVTPSDGTQDAFLPMAILRRAGFEDVREGASITCEVGSGAKGPLVTNVLELDNSTATAPERGPSRSAERPQGGGFDRSQSGGFDRPQSGGFDRNGGGHDRGGYGQDRAPTGPASAIEGEVKWFEPGKGFGFISPDGGGKDVFVHVTALRRSGVEMLEPGQRVRIDVVDGRKGLEADRVTLL